MTNLTLRQIIYQRHFLMSIVDLHFDKYIRAHHANHHNKHIDIDFVQSFYPYLLLLQ